MGCLDATAVTLFVHYQCKYQMPPMEALQTMINGTACCAHQCWCGGTESVTLKSMVGYTSSAHHVAKEHKPSTDVARHVD